MTTANTQKRLSVTDWATIVTLYQRGEKNIRELSEQFGVSLEAIRKGLKKRGVEKGSRLDEVVGEVDDVAREERERRVKQANESVERFAKINNHIVGLVAKRIIESQNVPGGVAVHNAEILTLKNAIAIVAKAREENWEILDIKELLGENAELPDLNVGEYTPDEIERIREANEEGYLQGLDDDDDEDLSDEDGDEDFENSED